MKIVRFILLSLMILALPISVFAKNDVTVSTTKINIDKGKTETFKITADNAVGRIDIENQDKSIISIDRSSEWIENNSIIVTVKAIKVGNAKIKVILTDVASFDEKKLDTTYIIDVTVKDENVSSQTDNTSKSNLSSNNNVTSVSVNDINATKISNNKYEVNINDTEEINIDVKAEDSKAVINGSGSKLIKDGLNTFLITITAEDGSENNIYVNVIKNDIYYLNDIETITTNNSSKEVEIILKDDDKVTKNDLEVINKNNTLTSLNYYDDEKVLYSWVIDGSKLDKTDEFNMDVDLITLNENNVHELSNAVVDKSNTITGKYVSFNYDDIPSGVSFKLYMADTYDMNGSINLYEYSKEKEELSLVKKDLVIKDGYVDFDLGKRRDYLLTTNYIEKNDSKESIIYAISAIIGLSVLALILKNMIKKMK